MLHSQLLHQRYKPTVKLKQKYKVTPCKRSEIKEFIEKNHYSKNINGCIADYCFKLIDENNNTIGAMFYGRMAMAGQWKRFTNKPETITELRRLVCIDNTPKNTESYFIGATLRWLRKNTNLEIIVSYSDLEYGHVGTIYKAANFQFWGTKPGAKVIIFQGKKYHDKTIRTKYKGKLKPFAQRIKNALENGEAQYKKTKGKNTYVYYLDKTSRT